uniref:Uncharacterized protein n=1 Tax=Timspurckia oligopyrenoides TaxID=708627 RepID=A0A7S1ES57_9RHOD|mmetsp:Transcript_4308/g.7561  ORF Transcript_4308/g.7561 Transcript_4308/m.7561 type:complete len:312 (+) Transcript_4308:238-1173(+)
MLSFISVSGVLGCSSSTAIHSSNWIRSSGNISSKACISPNSLSNSSSKIGLIPLRRSGKHPSKSGVAGLQSMMGGGFLGVGPMELAVVFTLGWIVLGPKELLNVARQAGKAIGSLKSIAFNARDNIQSIINADDIQEEFNKIVQSVSAPMNSAGTTTTANEKLESNSAKKDVSTVEKKDQDQSETAFQSISSSALLNSESNASTSDSIGGDYETSRFAEQLRRMNDPNQVSPFEPHKTGVPSTEISSSDLELSEELDLDELERRYELRRQMILNSSANPSQNITHDTSTLNKSQKYSESSSSSKTNSSEQQ